MRSLGGAFLAAVLFCSVPATAGELNGEPLADVLRGSLTAESSSATIQPALGRALSQLADLYMARRLGRPAVEQSIGRYQQMLHSAGPDAIIAVAAPAPALESVQETPDGSVARVLYERAASFGYPAAWVGLGTLYLDGHLPGEEKPMQQAFASFSRAAALGAPQGRLRAAELAILGLGTARDVAGGIATLRELAATGDARILLDLAALCLSGRIPLQSELGVTALQRAAALGVAEADMRLGDLYSRGEDILNDDDRAVRHYQAAAAQGLKDAEIRIAALRARGHGLPQDVAGAISALEALGKQGEAGAFLALGDLYSTGEVFRTDPGRARDFYLAAVGQGSEAGLLRLGDGYRDGKFGSRNTAKAAEFYRRALEAGNPQALLALGRLEASSPKRPAALRGAALLRRALEANTNGAAAVLAEAIFYGHGTAQAPSAALAILGKAAERGDRQALLALVSAYRDGKVDGRVLLVRKDTRKAQALLAAALDRLPVPERRIQRFLLDASVAKPGAFAGLSERFMALSRPERRAVLQDLPKANRSLYVSIAKSRLNAMGILSGKINGRSDRPFMAGMAKYCRTLLTARQCGQGPFSRDLARQLTYAF